MHTCLILTIIYDPPQGARFGLFLHLVLLSLFLEILHLRYDTLVCTLGYHLTKISDPPQGAIFRLYLHLVLSYETLRIFFKFARYETLTFVLKYPNVTF